MRDGFMKGLIVGLALCAALTGCHGRESTAPLAPSAVAAPVPGPRSQVTVVSALDERPVAAARVRVGTNVFETAPDGRVITADDLDGLLVVVEARGYLPRRTRVRYDRVTLWPAADDAAVAAIQQMAFRGDDGRLMLYRYSQETNLRLPLDRQDLSEPFGRAATVLNALTRNQLFAIEGRGATLYGPVWNVVPVASADCPFGICLPDASEIPPVGVIDVAMTDSALSLAATPLRALALSQLAGTNPLPGLLNPATPAFDTLTEFEQQTIRMVNAREDCTTWPDDDVTYCNF